jgi:WD40 repeat protein
MAPVSTHPATDNPFKGVSAFEKPDRERLFCREDDLILFMDRVHSATTTLLFAPSGVGKTSFLEAKVIPQLEDDGFFVACPREWTKTDPAEALKSGVRRALGASSGADANLPLAKLLESRFAVARPEETRIQGRGPRRAVLILDQFEELFQNHAHRPSFVRLTRELADVINDASLNVRVILSMREDFLGELSIFDNVISDPFANYYRLKHPSRREAEIIITRTCALQGVAVEPQNLARMTEELAALETVCEPAANWKRLFAKGAAATADDKSTRIVRNFVPPPYLQIACSELWTAGCLAAVANVPTFLASYEAGAANRAVRGYCERHFKKLRRGEKALLARAFDYLVTSRGAKMAYEAARLAYHMNTSEKKVEGVLDKLAAPDVRILRASRSPNGAKWFELYHDVYGPVARRWKDDYESGLRRVRNYSAGAFGAVALVAALGATTKSKESWEKVLDSADLNSASDYALAKDAHSNIARVDEKGANAGLAAAWGRRAVNAEMRRARDEAILSWFNGWKWSRDEAYVQRALRLTMPDGDALVRAFPFPSLRRAFFSRDGSVVVTWGSERNVRLWEAETGKPLGPAVQLAGRRAMTNEAPSADGGAPESGDRGTHRAGNKVVTDSAAIVDLHAAVHHPKLGWLITGSDPQGGMVWIARTGALLESDAAKIGVFEITSDGAFALGANILTDRGELAVRSTSDGFQEWSSLGNVPFFALFTTPQAKGVRAVTLQDKNSKIAKGGVGYVARDWYCPEAKGCSATAFDINEPDVNDIIVSNDGSTIGVLTEWGNGVQRWQPPPTAPDADSKSRRPPVPLGSISLQNGPLHSQFRLGTGGQHALGTTTSGDLGMWNTTSGKRVLVPFGFQDVSPDGRLVLSHIGDDAARLSHFVEPSPPPHEGRHGELDERSGEFTYVTAKGTCITNGGACAEGPGLKNYKASNGLFTARNRRAAIAAPFTIYLGQAGNPKEIMVSGIEPLRSLALSPDATVLAGLCGTQDSLLQSVHLWDAATGEHKASQSLNALQASSLSWSPDGRYLAINAAAAEPDCDFLVFDLARITAAPLSCGVDRSHGGASFVAASIVAPGPKGLFAVRGEHGDIRILRAEGEHLKLEASLPSPLEDIAVLAFDREGQRLVAGSDDGAIALVRWAERSNGVVLSESKQSIGAALRTVGSSGDGKTVYALSDWWLTRFDVHSDALAGKDAIYLGARYQGRVMPLDEQGNAFRVQVQLSNEQTTVIEVRFDQKLALPASPGDALKTWLAKLGLQQSEDNGQFTPLFPHVAAGAGSNTAGIKQ